MVNLVVRHSSLHMHQVTSTKPGNAANNVRGTKVAAGGYDRTVPSPIRIPSRENARAVSPLTTSESLFGGGTGAAPVVGGVVGAPGTLGASPRRHPAVLEDRYAPSSNYRGGDSDPQQTQQQQQQHLQQQQQEAPLTVLHHHSRYASPSTPLSHITRGRGERNGNRGRDPSPHHGRNADSPNNSSSNHATDDVVGAGEPECDYDTSVTPLYELLESSEWEAARLRCRTHPKEVRTWIVRRDGKSSKIRWKLLPLHAAVIFQAPTVVVSTLLDQFPLAAAKRDDQGMLPLHLAFRHHQPQDEALLKILLEQYPKGVSIKDRRDRYPLDHGKETQFSSHLMALYATAHSRCVSSSSTNSNSNNDSNIESKLSNSNTHAAANNAAAVAKATANAASAEREKLSVQYDSQLQTLKSMYEERIDNLAQEHRANMDDLRRHAEDEERVMLARHNQEMDELRDLLSREVVSGQRASELDRQAEELKESLLQANHETDLLRTVLRDQKQYEDELKDQVRKVLADQQTLYSLCTQQQEQLEQSHDMRDQLVRSILQKDVESHKACRVVNLEISRVAENIRRRGETILSSSNSGGRGLPVGTSAGAEDDDEDIDAGVGHEDDDRNNDVEVLMNDDHRRHEGALIGSSGAKEGDAVPGETVRRGVAGNDGGHNSNHLHRHHDHPHDDEISAITENSHF